MRMPSSAPSSPVSKKSRKSKHKRSAVEQQPVWSGLENLRPPRYICRNCRDRLLARDVQRARHERGDPGLPRAHVADHARETFPPCTQCSRLVLSLCASRRTSSIVIDSGDGGSHFVPIFVGCALPLAVTPLPARISYRAEVHSGLFSQGEDLRFLDGYVITVGAERLRCPEVCVLLHRKGGLRNP